MPKRNNDAVKLMMLMKFSSLDDYVVGCRQVQTFYEAKFAARQRFPLTHTLTHTHSEAICIIFNEKPWKSRC